MFMLLSDFDYNLPPDLIAQTPINPRDHSRLLVLDKKSGSMEHKHFYDIIDYFQEGDVLVMNNSKVFPARLIGKRKETGGKIEIFLLKIIRRDALPGRLYNKTKWQCLVGGRRAKPGLVVEFNNGLIGELFKDNNDGTWEVEFNLGYNEMMKVVEKIGEVPLPPYIKRESGGRNPYRGSDPLNYQTVYADEAKVGSVAAPTAGFHFTKELLEKIKNKGVQIEYVTLHVGLGTFTPVKVDDITKHKMHSEFVEIEKEVIEKIDYAKKKGKRIITVGTTSARALEAFSPVIARSGATWQSREQRDKHGIATLASLTRNDKGYSGWVNIFIYPGYKFKVVDAMITNFHLPKSTLLMLISAMAGKENIDKAYKEAIKEKYRFYSYGDAMMIF
jgi:S-adenosylmethionine:tRNA ribosyltransferase-isomerase